LGIFVWGVAGPAARGQIRIGVIDQKLYKLAINFIFGTKKK
jgi:hypothetical protein